LIREYYSKYIIFSFSGLRNAPRPDQIENFMLQLKERTGEFDNEQPENWLQAFNVLKQYLKSVRKTQKNRFAGFVIQHFVIQHFANGKTP